MSLSRLRALIRNALPWLLAIALLLPSVAAVSSVVTVEELKCSYDPALGKPNPFGSRAFITVFQRGQDTHFRYERFPGLLQVNTVGASEKVRAVTIENQRTMIFYNTDLEVARKLMRDNNDYFNELIGYVDLEGFASYDEVMSCG